MPFKLLFTKEASDVLDKLEDNKSDSKILKAVRKSLGYLEINPRHPGLNTHKFSSLQGPDGQEIFEAYRPKQYTSSIQNLLVLWTKETGNYDNYYHSASLRYHANSIIHLFS